METRAKGYVAVGAFVLVVLAGARPASCGSRARSSKRQTLIF